MEYWSTGVLGQHHGLASLAQRRIHDAKVNTPQNKIQNPNVEVRNKPKPAKPKFKIQNGPLEISAFWTFGFVPNFGFRI